MLNEPGAEQLSLEQFNTKLTDKFEKAYKSVITSVLLNIAWQLFLYWLKKRSNKELMLFSTFPEAGEPDYADYYSNAR